MIKNKLALVWKDDEIYIAHPLEKVTTKLFDNLSLAFGRPVGRTEKFLDLDKYSATGKKLQPEEILEKN